MLKIAILVFIVGLVLILIGLIKTKPWKNTEQKSVINQNEKNRRMIHFNQNEKSETGAYTWYLGMCKRDNEAPISRDLFHSLANESGEIDLSDLMEIHGKINEKQKVKIIEEMIKNDQDIAVETNEEKNKNEEFVKSAIAGYVANSTTVGTIFGGSLLGAMLGDKLKKK
jgi:hypothetical protein